MYYEEVVGILKKVKGEYFDFEDNLITEGYISSFDFFDIVIEIEDLFSISIPIGELKYEDFNNVSGICGIIEKYKKKSE